MGWPCSRARYLSWAIKNESFVWCGVQPSEVQGDFLACFGREIGLTCEAFAGLDSDIRIMENYQQLAAKRGKYIKAGMKINPAVDMERWVPPGMLKIFKGHKDMSPRMTGYLLANCDQRSAPLRDSVPS